MADLDENLIVFESGKLNLFSAQSCLAIAVALPGDESVARHGHVAAFVLSQDAESQL